MVELRQISKENIEDIVALQIHESQESYVASTAHSLDKAYVYSECAYPFAIYDDDTLVGFIMMGYYEVRNQYTLWEFLIDKKYQNKGYGRQALLLGIDYVIKQFGAKEIYTGVLVGNEVAKKLYCSVGFESTGVEENNMEELKLCC